MKEQLTEQEINELLQEIAKTQTEEEKLFNQTLDALGAKDYTNALKCARQCMRLTDGIERRIALVTLIQVAENKDDKLTDDLLKMAYRDNRRSSNYDKGTRNPHRR